MCSGIYCYTNRTYSYKSVTRAHALLLNYSISAYVSLHPLV